MKTESQLETETLRIADAIVELVERENGPVTLAQVERNVAGFATHEPPSWDYVVTHASGETPFWGDMTEAGAAALTEVMHARRVAIQFVNPLRYILENRLIKRENWQPIVLLPAKAANVDSPLGLTRYPKVGYERIASLAAAGLSPCRPLTARYTGATADHFFGANGS